MSIALPYKGLDHAQLVRHKAKQQADTVSHRQTSQFKFSRVRDKVSNLIAINVKSCVDYREKTKQAAPAKNSAARMTYMTSTKTCIGTPTTAVENLLPRDLAQ